MRLMIRFFRVGSSSSLVLSEQQTKMDVRSRRRLLSIEEIMKVVRRGGGAHVKKKMILRLFDRTTPSSMMIDVMMHGDGMKKGVILMND